MVYLTSDIRDVIVTSGASIWRILEDKDLSRRGGSVRSVRVHPYTLSPKTTTKTTTTTTTWTQSLKPPHLTHVAIPSPCLHSAQNLRSPPVCRAINFYRQYNQRRKVFFHLAPHPCHQGEYIFNPSSQTMMSIIRNFARRVKIDCGHFSIIYFLFHLSVLLTRSL